MKLKLGNVQRLRTGQKNVVSFEIPKQYEAAYAELIHRWPDRLSVEIGSPVRHRSTGPFSQSAHLNGHVQQICNETGNDFADVKLYVKRRAIIRGLPIKTTANGDVVYSIVDKEPLPISEADMTVEQCAWCIEECHVLAAELGIVLQEE